MTLGIPNGLSIAHEPGRVVFDGYHSRVAAENGTTAPTWEGVSDRERNFWRSSVADLAGAKVLGLEAEIEIAPNSRERSIAKTKAEEARMWLTKAPKFEGFE